MGKVVSGIDYGTYSSLLDIFDKSCERFPDRPMVTCMGATLSFSQVDELSRHLAAFLQQDLGLRPKDRIAIQLPNILQYPVAVYAALRAGLVIVNTNPLYTPRELLHQFTDAEVEVLITLTANLPVIDQIRKETSLATLIVTDPGDLMGMPSSAETGGIVYSFMDAVDQGRGKTVSPVTMQQDDLVCLQYTGGTTGLSKGAMLSHGNLIANLLQVNKGLDGLLVDGEEVYVVPLPLYHIFAFVLTFAVLAEGGHLAVLIPDPRNLDAFVAELKRRPFTAMAGLNTLFVALCHHEGFTKLDFSAFKLTAAGGMALNADTAELWYSVTGVRPSEGYGLTETSPTVTMNTPDAIVLGTVGTALADTEIRVIDDEGKSLPNGQAGELIVRGPQVMQGYWKKPQETADSLSPDGWFKTGDIAVIQDDGYVRIVDRLKDMILVSGFNVYPNEVEDVVMHHPGVLECAAIGVDDEKSGQVVQLFVVRRDPSLDAKSLSAYCRENLTGYKCPKHIVFRDELPKSNVGKILRKDLREEGAAS
jgi:long-chain acyl-CoA synthetase